MYIYDEQNGLSYRLVGDYYLPDILPPQGITVELKAQDQMKWVGMVNSIKCDAEEMVLKELIYQ